MVRRLRLLLRASNTVIDFDLTTPTVVPDKAVSAGLFTWLGTRSLEVTDVAMTDIKANG